ncbi:glycosyltransferase family 2 protein [Terrabacter sp. Ter38]|uniref:glycosyltransferase n=1 Tax=Terrabacter sp. Ter38 TaxID=2926030 RepID=UPI0021176ADD|nr:glycosyltransferase family A protein [Terrabacter sp. Ter38]
MTAHLPRPLTHVHVIVPANDEEALLSRALGSIDDAVAELHRSRPDVHARVVLVLDACVDRSRDVAAQHRDVVVAEVDRRCVGAARAHGVVVATADVAEPDTRRHWLAGTDADCVVPADWLVRQVMLADTGLDLVTGTVQPDEELDPDCLARWHALHQLRDGHPHVHGANLGVRLSAYLAAGGFEPLPVHEDVRLVERVRASGAACLASSSVHVRTSGRTRGRMSGGFADYLGALAAQGALTG